MHVRWPRHGGDVVSAVCVGSASTSVGLGGCLSGEKLTDGAVEDGMAVVDTKCDALCLTHSKPKSMTSIGFPGTS
jgi:hypothetical protein